MADCEHRGCADRRVCRAARKRAYNAAYHVAHREERAAYRAAHREERAAYNAAYRAAHREEVAAYNAAYRAGHRKERAAYSAVYRAEWRNAIRIRRRKWLRRIELRSGRKANAIAEIDEILALLTPQEDSE